MNYLFICGAPRSGTTAMWQLLIGDERIVLGVERYGNLFFNKSLTTELYELDRFSSIQTGDTFYKDLSSYNEYYEALEDKFAKAIYIGDKIPLLYNYLDGLFKNIPSAKVIFMIRNIFDIAASYENRANDPDDNSWSSDQGTEAAIKDWRKSLEALKQYLPTNQVLPVIYEEFFSSDGNIKPIYDFLELDVSEKVLSEYKCILARSAQLEGARKRDLSSNNVYKICESAPFDLYRELLIEARLKNGRMAE